MKRLIFLIVFLQLMFPGMNFAQINVLKIDNNTSPQTKEGIFYSLPRTVVKVEVTIDRVENYKGPYADYALRFLGLKNVVPANTIEYKIGEISITTSAEPDPDQYYFIELGEKISKGEKAGILSLTDAGVILGTLNDGSDSAASGMVKSLPAPAEGERDAFGELFKYSADVSVFEKVDTIIRKFNIDTMTVERQYYKRTMVEKYAGTEGERGG